MFKRREIKIHYIKTPKHCSPSRPMPCSANIGLRYFHPWCSDFCCFHVPCVPAHKKKPHTSEHIPTNTSISICTNKHVHLYTQKLSHSCTYTDKYIHLHIYKYLISIYINNHMHPLPYKQAHTSVHTKAYTSVTIKISINICIYTNKHKA